MMVEVLQAKLQNATVTDSSVNYRGSITVDQDILDDMGVVPYQSCDVNLKGEDQYGKPFRGKTYFLSGERGTGKVEANGALAYHISKNDTVHINVYCNVPREAAKDHKPIIIESNKPYINGKTKKGNRRSGR